jgi:hypothetical protein
MSFRELVILDLVTVWSVSYLAAVVVALSSYDPDKRADARKVMDMLRPPWSWLGPREWSTPDDDTARSLLAEHSHLTANCPRPQRRPDRADRPNRSHRAQPGSGSAG